MTARACSLCNWWMPAYERASQGTCRAHPPSVDRGETVWPATDGDEWCGSFHAAERLAGHRDRRLQPQESQHGA